MKSRGDFVKIKIKMSRLWIRPDAVLAWMCWEFKCHLVYSCKYIVFVFMSKAVALLYLRVPVCVIVCVLSWPV